MKIFYATISSNQNFDGYSGPGYVEIYAEEYDLARELIRDATDNKWAFIYDNLNKVHPSDRNLLGVID